VIADEREKDAFPTGNGDVRTMYLGTRFITSTSRVLVVDDFMRGGSTAAGMLLMAREFNASVVGVGVFISSGESAKKTVTDYRSLLELSVSKGIPKLKVTDA
jgi:purine operon repressor